MFSKKKHKYKYTIKINNHELKQEHTTKYLGITIDDTLTWKPHLHKLKTTLSRGCYALSKLRMYLTQDAMKTVYHSLFHSKMQYGIASWGGCSVTNQLPIFRLQKRALRLVCSQPNHTSSHPLFIETKILKLFDVYRLNICKIVRKMIDGKLDGNLELQNINNIHNYNTRLRINNNFFTQSIQTNLIK